MFSKAFSVLALAVISSLLIAGQSVADVTTDAGSLNTLAARPAGGDEFLDPDVAFRLEVQPEGPDRVRLRWSIAPRYYLYRDRIKVKTDTAGVSLGKTDFPPGILKNDEYFGEQVIYHDELIARVPLSRAAGRAQPLGLAVTYQGCAEAGLCYPPITKTFDLRLPPGGAAAGGTVGGGVLSTVSAGGATSSGAYVSEQDGLARLIVHGSILAMLAIFFGSGLLLAFTPCVLPMVPILSRLIAGQGPDVTPQRAFALSLTYVLGMALTYTAAGAAAAAAGQQVQAMFQRPWVIVLFALVFVAMALSMFGLYTVQMPAALQTRLSGTSNRQKTGTFGGVAVMGALSALIVTTCVGPALVAALVVIGQSGNVARGAGALFAMSLGMGAPLLVIGTSAGALLPKAGAWMDAIKKLFGVLMLAMAAWMLARILPARATLLAFAIPAVLGAWVLWRFTTRPSAGLWVTRIAGVAAAVYGALLLYGTAAGATDPLRPWVAQEEPGESLAFRAIRSIHDLDREVLAAAAASRGVLLDFYADWCVSCKEMERYTFTDSRVKQSLASTVLLRADVTANNADDQALLKRFGIFGPPTIAFYGPDGQERPQYRVVGYMKAAEFTEVLRQAGVVGTVPPPAPGNAEPTLAAAAAR
ncbi:MAG: protein-disulfide reductase DsbD [Gammaproteobacteria bacterium]|nr:protein-disulfide reductase DsbD [Gammaproteobacteria bacterium]